MDEQRVRVSATVTGAVQGVGFRAWVRRQAQTVGLVGSATNLADGTVEVVAQGSRPDCEKLLADLNGGRCPGEVATVTANWTTTDDNLDDFLLG